MKKMKMAELDAVALSVVVSVLIVLSVLFVLLIGYTSANRFLIQRQEDRYEFSESYIQPLIYEYLYDEVTKDEFVSRLRNIYDVVVAYRFLNTMIDNMKGPEHERLKELLDVDRFKKFFLKNLKSKSPVDLAQACMYFAQKKVADEKALGRLEPLQQHSYAVIVYAATFAMINAESQEVRDKALRVFLNRKDNASMAVTDLVFKYVNKHHSREKAAETLFHFATNLYVPVQTSVSVIQMFPELGFYQLAEPLFEEFRKKKRADFNGMYTAALIHVLGEFMHPEVGNYILKEKYWKSNFQRIRLSVGTWLKENYSDEYKRVLKDLIRDDDLTVRFITMQVAFEYNIADEVVSCVKVENLTEWDEIKRLRSLE